MEVSDDFVGTVMRAGKRLVAGASLELAYCNRRLVSVSSAWKLDTVTVLPPATRYFYVERERKRESRVKVTNFIHRMIAIRYLRESL